MAERDRTALAWWCAATIFLSAFLLFQVQPIISKMILPWFGGSPAVWSTCMLFFQVLLLAGYGYAHFLNERPPRQQAWIHFGLLLISGLLLPIIPGDRWKPEGSANPTLRILALLAANVGLPYFLLSTTGPLVQAWFNRACPLRSVYRLYALSNVGSLGALLSYPFFFEPRWTTSAQGWMWSLAYVGFLVICGSLALVIGRIPALSRPDATADESANATAKATAKASSSGAVTPSAMPSAWDRTLWIALPALASTCLLAITNHLCQDVAVVPFMWLAPLSLYLITFIICFDNPAWYLRRTFSVLAMASILFLSLVMMNRYVASAAEGGKLGFKVPGWIVHAAVNDDFGAGAVVPDWAQEKRTMLGGLGIVDALRSVQLDTFKEKIRKHVGLYLTTMFLTCMICHGELARLKPAPRHLTSYFLMISAGGALGGTFVALICPRVASTYVELDLSLVLGFLVAAIVANGLLVARFRGNRSQWRTLPMMTMISAALFSLGGLVIVISGPFRSNPNQDLVTLRSFYGILHVQEAEVAGVDAPVKYRDLLNGRILHGRQFDHPDYGRVATTYFGSHSGVGKLMQHYPNQESRRVGIVGLGTGSMAAWGDFGDYYRFYEINPQVELIARVEFSYLKDSAATTEVMLGDARLSMESHSEKQNYDIIVLDAFSGDAIPVHLLTLESVKLYDSHLKPDGVIAVHISNLHLELAGVVAKIAEALDFRAVEIYGTPSNADAEFPSSWVLLTRNEAFLDIPEIRAVSQHIHSRKRLRTPLWTDQYSNLLAILKTQDVLPVETYVFGRCQDSEGEPVSNALIEIIQSPPSNQASDGVESRPAQPADAEKRIQTYRSDARGRFEIELQDVRYDAWEYRILVSSERYETQEIVIDEAMRQSQRVLVTLPAR
ncbi:MAG: hypothetical protein FJ295_17750 [Planctomycetes bacterium]|nr:hypothetical protein [Planctomycetota bacterium]